MPHFYINLCFALKFSLEYAVYNILKLLQEYAVKRMKAKRILDETRLKIILNISNTFPTQPKTLRFCYTFEQHLLDKK